MNQATITVAYVNPPKPGKKSGSVKDTDGQFWGALPDKLAQMQQGGTYTIDYETREWQGKTYCDVVNIAAGHAPAPKANGMNGAAKPTSNGGGKNDEQIFCLALLKSGIEAGHVKWEQAAITETIKSIRAIYADTFGGGR